MLKMNFSAAINSRTPLEQPAVPDADVNASGNAFAGSVANHDHEMLHALHGAIMDGDQSGNSSIANAGMRLAAKFGSVASQSEKDAEKSRSLYMQAMMQQVLRDMDARIADMTEQINLLQTVLDDPESALWSASDGSELTDKENEALQTVMKESGITADEFFAMPAEQRKDITQDTLVVLKDRKGVLLETRQEITNVLDTNPDIEAFNEVLPVEKNRFLDDQYEAAAIHIEETQGIEFDRHNITRDNFKLLQDTVYRLEIEAEAEALSLNEGMGEDHELSGIMAMPLNM